MNMRQSLRSQTALVSILGLVVGLFAVIPDADAAAPQRVGIQGRLLNVAGGPISDGLYKVKFSLYTAEKGSAAVWSGAPGPDLPRSSPCRST